MNFLIFLAALSTSILAFELMTAFQRAFAGFGKGTGFFQYLMEYLHLQGIHYCYHFSSFGFQLLVRTTQVARTGTQDVANFEGSRLLAFQALGVQ
jgi:hypothetical protein